MVNGIQVRVMTYNVRSNRGDMSALGVVVRELAPDIAIIQEGPRRLRWRQKCAALARLTGMLVAGGGLPSVGNLILTRVRIGVSGVECLTFPLTPGRHMRGAALVDCRVGGTRFVVAGSHLSLDAGERVSQAQILKKYLDDTEHMVIFGADLNENSGGAAWRFLADGMVDTAVATHQEDVATFPSCHPCERIDGIFVDPRCEVTGYRVVKTPTVCAASDHLPVVVDLVLPLLSTHANTHRG